MPDPLAYRQSRLKSFVTCPRRTVLDSGFTGGTVGASADLGSAFHAVAAEILRTLRRTGETQMPTQEAVEVMREVMAAGPWILAPGDGTAGSTGYDMLLQMTLAFCDEVWNPSRLLAIEDRLSHPVVGPDGVARMATGTPDVVIADPPHTILIIDQKTGIAKPPTPRDLDDDAEVIRGLKYMSDHADFQLHVYGLLALKQWPRAQTVTLRERNWRWLGPWREATITREALEHDEPYLGDLMMKLEMATTADDWSELAQPRSGPHCTTRCPVARSCPIPREQRGLGALETEEDAEAEAARFVVVDALRSQMLKALKARHEATGEYIDAPGGLLGWHEKPAGGREFKIKAPV